MKIVLNEQDLLPLIHDYLLNRYPQFVMKRKGWFSDKAVLSIECELSTLDIDQIK